jgi:uncharacterized protein with PIN domain
MAGHLASHAGITPSEALAQVYEELAAKPYFRRPQTQELPRFFCDAGLGGLARWLRAAGYEAAWVDGIEDGELLRQAQAQQMVVLTTDSLLMQRRVVRDGIIPALWLPPTVKVKEHLATVMREFRLQPRPARCMRCGGVLQRRDKESLKKDLPPRTYAWLHEFFACQDCGGLFWHGTHWRRIERQLAATWKLAGPPGLFSEHSS